MSCKILWRPFWLHSPLSHRPKSDQINQRGHKCCSILLPHTKLRCLCALRRWDGKGPKIEGGRGRGGGGGITGIWRKMGFKDCEDLIWSIIKKLKIKSRTRGVWAVKEQHVIQHKMLFEINQMFIEQNLVQCRTFFETAGMIIEQHSIQHRLLWNWGDAGVANMQKNHIFNAK